MRLLLVGATLSAGLYGCGVVDGGSGGKRTSDPRIAGAWQSDCIQGDTALQFTQEFLHFDGSDRFERRTKFHDDSACQTAGMQSSVRGTYELLGEGAEGAHQVDYVIEGVAVRVDSQAAAERLNERKTCGRADWTTGKEVKIASATCLGVPARAGQSVYDIYEVDGATLYVGKPLLFFDGNAPSARPFKVNTEKPFFKN